MVSLMAQSDHKLLRIKQSYWNIQRLFPKRQVKGRKSALGNRIGSSSFSILRSDGEEYLLAFKPLDERRGRELC
ncbi:hypothetical protein V6N11_014132 [Hibiscus sabdariffa]|uniref:Uncharacterized protein n=2 Tax=Hibiscus sabdariffa TaxID=183260 RepID=A0ABR2E5N7_9ROSI